MFKTILLLSFLTFHFRVFAQAELILVNCSKAVISPQENFNYIKKNLIRTDSITAQKHSLENICGQALVGSICGAGFAVLPFSAVSSNLGSKDQANTVSAILTLAWYTFGTAVGVHWVAKSENPDLSFWGTFGASAIGAGIGFGLVSTLSSGFRDPPYFSAVIAALFPIASSMIYTSCFADWPSENQNTTLQMRNLSHRDLVNSSKLFELNLLRINF